MDALKVMLLMLVTFSFPSITIADETASNPFDRYVVPAGGALFQSLKEQNTNDGSPLTLPQL